MGDNIVKLPPPEAPPELLIGPFEEWRVMVQGKVIPRLTGYWEGDKICLVVDRRFAGSFDPDAARTAAWLIAEALAIGEGYAWSGSENKDRPFAPKGMEIAPSNPKEP